MSSPAISTRWAIPAILLVALAVWIAWVGFLASDDAFYFDGAKAWLIHPPYAGIDHWTTRFPLILSFAGAITLFGQGFAAFHLTSLFWFVAVLALVGLFTRSLADARAAWISVLLSGTMSVVATQASVVNCDLPEVFFLLAAAWLLGRSITATRPLREGFLAGLCFGLAVLCRETAIIPMVGLAPFFLFGRVLRRDVLLAAAAGFLAMLGSEMLFQWAVTGDPLHRYGLAYHHDSHIDRAANLEGNFLVHPVIDPLLVLLINDDFGWLFWVGAASLFLAFRAGRGKAVDPRLVVLAALALANFVLIGALYGKLVLNPRYFTLAALAMTIWVSIWLAGLGRRARLALVALVVATNMLLESASNHHPQWVGEALVIAARDHPDRPIFTPFEDYKRGMIRLDFAGLGNVRAGSPQPGALYLSSAPQAPAHGQLLASYAPPPTPLGAGLQAIGLIRLVPSHIATRLSAPGAPASLWLIPPDKPLP